MPRSRKVGWLDLSWKARSESKIGKLKGHPDSKV